MTIQKIKLGLDVPGAESGSGGDSARESNEKINENFSNINHAASRYVGTRDNQIPTALDVKSITKSARRVYKTLSDAVADRPNMPAGAIFDVLTDSDSAKNKTYQYIGDSFVAIKQVVSGSGSKYIKELADSPLMYAVVDPLGYLTDLQIDEQGRIPTRVIRDWASRMSPYFDDSSNNLPPVQPSPPSKPKLDLSHNLPIPTSTKQTTVHASDTHHKNGELLPLMPDINRLIIIGSSSAQKSERYFTTELRKINPNLKVLNVAYSGATIEAQEPWVGSNPLLIKFANDTIKASGDSSITVTPIIPTSAYVTGITGWASGVKGSIKVSRGRFYFTASGLSSNLSLSGAVQFIPEKGNEFRNAVQLLWLGKNNLTSTDNSVNDVDALLDKTDRVIDYSASLVKRTIVMTHYADTDEPAQSAVRDRINRCNALYKLRYRDNVFDAEAILLGTKIFSDLGITRTQADINAQRIGNLAPSLASDRVHATNAVYNYIAQRLREFVAERKYLEV